MLSQRHHRNATSAWGDSSSTSSDTSSTQSSSPTSTKSNSPTPLKRPRILADVDGEDSLDSQRKKRRLRLELITSRLSRPFAFPTTHIVGRGSVRVGIWARPQNEGTNVFRKAAILNCIKRDRAPTKELVERRLGLHQAVAVYAPDVNMDLDVMPYQYESGKPAVDARHRETALNSTPSPHMSPNYDIFDDEDDDLEGDESDILVDDPGAYAGTEDDSDPDDYETLCPFDEVLIEHHQKPLIDSKPENSAIAKEIQLQLPSERCAMEPFF
ncbi:MAG: hypothetical protein Q9191_006884 [Dirinaria sp. TL-2023a]